MSTKTRTTSGAPPATILSLAIAMGGGLSNLPSTANAADAAEPKGPLLQEIIVSARKRGDEKLQDVPATITALSGDQLAAMGAFNFDEFAYQVPGLTFSDEGAGQKRYVLRGVRSAGQEQVAVYYDEVPVPGIQGASGDSGSQTTDLKLFDVNRVEVLKGPQGTTFGANSQAGTVRFVLNKPEMNELSSLVQLGANSVSHGDQGSNAYGMLNVPLVEDRLAFRGVAYYDRDAGYIDNVRLNLSDINWNESVGARLALRLQPSDNLTLDLMAWAENRDSGGSSRYNPYDSFSADASNPDFRANSGAPLTEIRNIAFFNTGDLQVGDYVRSNMPDDQRLYSLTMNWDFARAALVATGSLYKRDFAFKRDSTWVLLRLGIRPEPVLPTDPAAVRPDFFPALTDQSQDITQKAFELRLNSKAGPRLQWLGGVFYRDRESGFRSYVPAVDIDTGYPLAPLQPPTGYIGPVPGTGIEDCNPCVTARVNDRNIKEKAVFGELSYALSDQFEIMGGLRWFEAEQTDLGLTLFPFALFTTAPPPAADPRRFKEDKVIKKIQLSYRPTANLLFYALASQGFRLGGTNQQGIVAVPPGYESDSIWNYEVAAKTTLLDGRLLLNAALFMIDWKDIQVSGRDPTGAFGFLGNAGAAQIQGVELELQARPSDGLTLSAGASWLPKHELTEDQITDQVVAPGRKGDELPFIPEFTANAAAHYDWVLPASGWDAFVRGEFAYHGESNSELQTASRFNRKQNAYEILNLRAGVNKADSGLNLTFYIENVLDERGDLRVRDEDSLLTFKWTNQPRTVGLELSKRF
ncbi:MAG: TonB-dependent receptor [Steroidobacteraceae bacterium]